MHNESFYIDRLSKWLRSSGVEVDLFCFDLHYGGLYRSETKQIFLNCPEARMALIILAHEVGHWLGHEVFGELPEPYQRERQAFVYGWRALQLVGAGHLISRQEWITHHQESKEEMRQPCPCSVCLQGRTTQ